MKTILNLSLLLIILLVPLSANAQSEEEITEELLTNTQQNEIVLNTENDKIFDELKKETHIYEPDSINDEAPIMDNTELDFEIFKVFDKDNDNVIDEDTILGKIYHSKITRTDIPSFLYKDDLTFKYEKSPINKIQLYGAYRGAINNIFRKDGNYSTDYDNLNTQIGMYGSFKHPDYRFKLALNPIPTKGLNIADRLISDAYIMNTSIPNHQIVAGYSRVQTGVEGGTSTYILPFVTRSQIARNFGSAKSLAVKLIGNYQYVDYNISAGSAGRYITSGMPGAEFNGWVNVKPFGNKYKRLGKLTIGGGLNSGHNQINYNVGSIYLGYHHKKLWTNIEAAIADGYNGSNGISTNNAKGFAATAGWKFNPHFQILGRIDQFDPNRNVSHDLRNEYTLGLNWFIKGQALKLILNYVFCNSQNMKDSHKIILATQVLL